MRWWKKAGIIFFFHCNLIAFFSEMICLIYIFNYLKTLKRLFILLLFFYEKSFFKILTSLIDLFPILLQIHMISLCISIRISTCQPWKIVICKRLINISCTGKKKSLALNKSKVHFCHFHFTNLIRNMFVLNYKKGENIYVYFNVIFLRDPLNKEVNILSY